MQTVIRILIAAIVAENVQVDISIELQVSIEAGPMEAHCRYPAIPQRLQECSFCSIFIIIIPTARDHMRLIIKPPGARDIQRSYRSVMSVDEPKRHCRTGGFACEHVDHREPEQVSHLVDKIFSHSQYLLEHTFDKLYEL
jgi:hypothetical protein